MKAERWELISRIFSEAVALDGDERRRYILAACENDSNLAAEVGSLLSAHDKAGDFIERPIVENIVGEISEMPTLTGTFLGPYRIEKSIGRGGMGDVYLATDTRLGRMVALKKLPDRYASDPHLLKRLRTEARAAASLNHPNVATIYSVEEADSRTFITMEYVEGRTLDPVAVPGGMDVKQFLDIFVLVTSALGHAHAKGVIHRDLKPGNIMIATEGQPKLLDFGLAQFADQSPLANGRDISITKPGLIVGTPSYMSPEQAKGSDVDHRTDIFSLGVVMYEALTGAKPFVGQSSTEVISNILKTDPASVSSIRSGIPTGVSRLVAQCLEKRRADRPQSMDEIRIELTNARGLIEAGTSTGSFARRLYRESRSVGAWLILAPVVLVLAVSAIAWLYFSR
ncbi:MAG TPA: serine/threonine-protein kinase, partial [Pyrinomonadaceae bacterium]